LNLDVSLFSSDPFSSIINRFRYSEMRIMLLTESALTQRLAQVKLAIFDVDGVLTDGRLYYDNHGNEFKAFHAQDGHGMKQLQQSGIPIAIITARQSSLVAKRMSDLGIQYVFQGARDKLAVFEQLLADLALPAEAVCYVGDDLLDLPTMQRCGLAISVPNGYAGVKSRAHYITQASGGQGAAREVCDLILNAQGKLDALIAHYLR
jgi:3-deoxy-D-manno-octulosonate 8-phosphate phosphatase (KDO 8-P phosphatase)